MVSPRSTGPDRSQSVASARMPDSLGATTDTGVAPPGDGGEGARRDGVVVRAAAQMAGAVGASVAGRGRGRAPGAHPPCGVAAGAGLAHNAEALSELTRHASTLAELTEHGQSLT